MHYTLPQFMDRIVNQRGVQTSANNGRVVFHYFAQCLAGCSTTYWKSVVDQHAKREALKTYSLIAHQLHIGTHLITFAAVVRFQIWGHFWISQAKLHLS